MKKTQKLQDEEPETEAALPPVRDATGLGNWALQGWIGLAVWMSFGLLLEGLIGFRVPDYLNDPVRRDLFRLAHAHGAVFSVVLVIAGIYLRSSEIDLPKAAGLAMRAGVIVMPLGFLLGGLVTYGSDPNPLVFLSPLGGLLIIFGVVAIALLSTKKQ